MRFLFSRRSSLAMGLLLCSLSAAAADLELKGMKPGMGMDSLKLVVPSLDQICAGEIPTKGGQIVCFYYPLGGQVHKWRGSNVEALNTLAEHEITRMTIVHDGKRLAMIDIDLPGAAYRDVVGALSAKFGKPSQIDKSPVQNRMGAVFDQERLRWQSGDLVLAAVKRTDKLDEMNVSLISISASRAAAERVKEADKKASKDI